VNAHPPNNLTNYARTMREVHGLAKNHCNVLTGRAANSSAGRWGYRTTSNRLWGDCTPRLSFPLRLSILRGQLRDGKGA
jgi:hypothetical protein